MNIKNLITYLTILSVLVVGCKKAHIEPKDTEQSLSQEHKNLLKDKKYGGSVTIFDHKNNKLLYTNKIDTYSGKYLPASTFKIINSCIALERNVVQDQDDNISIPYDGIFRKNQAPIKLEAKNKVESLWNRSQNLKTAYQNSVIWFYLDIAKKIRDENNDDYKNILQSCGYGNWNNASLYNNDYDSNKDKYEGEPNAKYDFWNYGDFGVSPIQQINFLRAFYEEKLSFIKKPSTYGAIKDIMLLGDIQHEGCKIRSKSGWTNFGDKQTGWYIGYVEYNDNVYFFATVLTQPKDSEDLNFIPARRAITQKILADIGALPKNISTSRLSSVDFQL